MFLLDRQLPATRRQRGQLDALAYRLFAGFSEPSFKALSAMAGEKEAQLHSAPGRAANVLAYWQYRRGEFALARQYLDQIVPFPLSRSKKQVAFQLLRAQTYASLGDLGPAKKLVDCHWSKRLDTQLSVALRCAIIRGQMEDFDSRPNEHPLLKYLNAKWREAGLRQVRIHDESRPFSVANLEADPASQTMVRPVQQQKVSIISPVYNAADTLAGMLRGLQQQSYENIQVIIVDDCSTDATAEIAAKVCEDDKRFHLIRQKQNLGAYVARNAALAQATGQLVTVQCGDDWSHPDKLACAVAEAGRSNHLYHWAGRLRLAPDNWALEKGRSISNLVHPEWPSALMRTELVRSMGGWNTIRIAGDTELHSRINFANGFKNEETHRVTIVPETVLSLAAAIPTSLSHHKRTNVRTLSYGIRKNVATMARAYYRSNRDDLTKSTGEQGALFPVPGFIRPVRTEPTIVKLAMVGDFTDAAWSERFARLASTYGTSLGVFQYPNYEAAEPCYALPDALCDLVLRYRACLLSAGENVEAQQFVLATSHQLAHKLDTAVSINCEKLTIVGSQSDLENETLIAALRNSGIVGDKSLKATRFANWADFEGAK